MGLRKHYYDKTNGGDGIPAELFQILKDGAVKVLHSICQQIWKTQQWPQTWKRSVFIPIPKKGNAKECSNYCTIALISHASKVMLKILQARLQLQINCELPDTQVGFREGRETRDQIANIHWIIEKVRVAEKHLFLFYCLYQSYAVHNAYHDGCILHHNACRSGSVLDNFQYLWYRSAGDPDKILQKEI